MNLTLNASANVLTATSGIACSTANAAIDGRCAFLQELLHLDAVLAESALRHFQSCVRTTLLLCNGYECQEKVSHTVCPTLVSVFMHVKIQSLEASMFNLLVHLSVLICCLNAFAVAMNSQQKVNTIRIFVKHSLSLTITVVYCTNK